MPLMPSRNACDTVDAALPRQDTMPMPVTATRRTSEALRRAEQSNAQIACRVYRPVVDQRAAIGDHHRQLAAHHAAHVDFVAHEARILQHLAGELHFADAERAATSRFAQPWQKETGQLPHGIETKATRHHRVADEVTF